MTIQNLFQCAKPLFFFMVLAACAVRPLPVERIKENQLVDVEIAAEPFRLKAFFRALKPDSPLSLYIEGDGYAWANRFTPSSNPTPRNPVALQLALRDDSPNLAYLARPCQYVEKDPACLDSAFWTYRRFAPEVVGAMNAAIDVLVEKTNASGIHLVGYSGGGAMAVLLTARRQDVLSLRTIAGNLDTESLNRHHHVSAMPESLNPIDVAQEIRAVPQRHFVGKKDKTVPPLMALRFVEKAGLVAQEVIVEIDGANHENGWEEIYTETKAQTSSQKF